MAANTEQLNRVCQLESGLSSEMLHAFLSVSLKSAIWRQSDEPIVSLREKSREMRAQCLCSAQVGWHFYHGSIGLLLPRLGS